MPPQHAAQVERLLAEACQRPRNRWREDPPFAADGQLVGYIEIPRDSLRKVEYRIATDDFVLDRHVDPGVGGYPVNYGFIPGTVAHDGDPLDVLVPGPALAPGERVQGRILGVLYMRDEKGYDAKVILEAAGASDGPHRHDPADGRVERDAEQLGSAEKQRIADYFARYKHPDSARGKWSTVSGWGDACEARRLIALTRVVPAGFACPAVAPPPDSPE